MKNIKISTKYNNGGKFIARNINRSLLWSPRDLISGKVYEWNRGVIGIPQNGDIIKRDIDKLKSNHAPETRYIGEITGCFTAKENPYEAAVEVSSKGTLIIQTEGKYCFIFLILLIPNFYRLYQISFYPQNLQLPSTETGYISGWTSGWGIKEASEYLIFNSSASSKSIRSSCASFFVIALPPNANIFVPSNPPLRTTAMSVVPPPTSMNIALKSSASS